MHTCFAGLKVAPKAPYHHLFSPQGQDTGCEVVSQKNSGREWLAWPHRCIGHPQSHCLIQRHLLVLWGVLGAKLHAIHWEGLLPRVLIPTRGTAPRALSRGLQRVGQCSPRGGTP